MSMGCQCQWDVKAEGDGAVQMGTVGALSTERLPIGRRARRPAAAVTAMRHGGARGAWAGNSGGGRRGSGRGRGHGGSGGGGGGQGGGGGGGGVGGWGAPRGAGDPGRSRSELPVQTVKRRWPALDASATGSLRMVRTPCPAPRPQCIRPSVRPSVRPSLNIFDDRKSSCFFGTASSIVGRPSPGTRPARSLTYLEVLNRILYLEHRAAKHE